MRPSETYISVKNRYLPILSIMLQFQREAAYISLNDANIPN